MCRPEMDSESNLGLSVDVMAHTDPFWEACARHTSRHTSRTERSIYVCEDCYRRLQREAFNNRPPLYHGDQFKGFCGLCNDQTLVRVRLWFACAPCWSMILSYQKNFAASKAVHEYWDTTVRQALPTLQLLDTDETEVRPYARSKLTKKLAAAELSSLDFLVEEKANQLFHIELKAGPGAVDEMREFQLDINDSNDIIGVVNNTGLPAYIFHVQLRSVFQPPTRSTEAVNIWWTDLPAFLANRRKIAQRRGEDKQAGYYDPRCFRPIDQFLDELRGRGYEAMSEQLRHNPPQMS